MSRQSIRNDLVVAIAYRAMVNGEMIEQVTSKTPVEYLHGKGNIIPGLENALTGRKLGESFVVIIHPKDGYGEYDESQVETIPRENFRELEELKPGTWLKLVDAQGDAVDALIREINNEIVILDFNRSLAGKTLIYIVEVVGIREPTPEEVSMGIPESLKRDMTYSILSE